MLKIHESQSCKGSVPRWTSPQETKSSAVPGRDLLSLVGAGAEWSCSSCWAMAATPNRALPPSGLYPQQRGPLGSEQLSCRWLHLAQHSWAEKTSPCPRLARRNRFHGGSVEMQNWSARGRVERQGASHKCFSLWPLAAFASSPPSLSHKDFNCSHGQHFGLGRHPASLADPKWHLAHSWRCERNNQAESFHHPQGTRGDTIDLPRNMQEHPQTFHDHLLWVCFVIKQPWDLALAGKLNIKLLRGDICHDFLIIYLRIGKTFQ